MNSVNLQFIKKLNPMKITLAGFLMWFLLFFLFKLNVKYELKFYPILFIFLNYLFFILGLSVLKYSKIKEQIGFEVDYKVLKKILYILISIAAFGLFLKLFDKFYLRGATTGNSITENRVLLSETGPSIISIISAVTNPFSFLPLFIYYYIKSKNKYLFLISLILFFAASYEYIAMGSRSGLFIIIILFMLFLFYFKKLRLSLNKVIGILFIFFFLGVYTINIFVHRTTDFTKSDKASIRHILTNAGYNFTIEPTIKTRNAIINNKNKTMQSAHLGLINFVQYYTHGMYEFGYLYSNYIEEHHYGTYTFNVFAKFSNIIFKTKIDLQKIQKSPPRTGIYTTFFGPIYIDFGWYSLLFMFIFGVFQKNIYNKVIIGRFQYIPLLFYFLIINFFMPVINFVNGAQGLYTLSSFIIFVFLYSLLAGRIIISNKNGNKKYFKILNLKQKKK